MITPGKKGISSIRLACGCVWGGTFLITNWWRRAQLTLGDTIPEQVDLGCIGKLAKQTRKQLLFFSVPASVSNSKLLPTLSLQWTVSEINPFLLYSLLVTAFSQQQKVNYSSRAWAKHSFHELEIVFSSFSVYLQLSVFLNNFQEKNNSNQQKDK